MSSKSTKELGKTLPANIRLLSSLIARKPEQRTDQWASVPEQSFFHYTSTSTINLIHSMNEMLIENDWPFPPLFDARQELELIKKDGRLDHLFGYGIVRQLLFHRSLNSRLLYAFSSNQNIKAMRYEHVFIRYFHSVYRELFKIWSEDIVLEKKKTVLADIRNCYERKLWSACISTTLPLLDLLMRNILANDSLNATIQVIRNAFFENAGLTANDLKPGYALWNSQYNDGSYNTFAKSLEEDLRLPGIYLASFFEFANSYYAWYSSSREEPPKLLNRHAVIHCAGEYWTQASAVKLLSFFELTRRMRPFLGILIHGASVVDDLIDNLKMPGGVTLEKKIVEDKDKIPTRKKHLP